MPRHVNYFPGSFEERCRAHAERKEADAYRLPPGEEQEDLLRDARQIKIAAELDKWLTSPGLRSPS